MAETFRSPADRENWERRRRLLLDMLAAAVAPLAARGLVSHETNGWAFRASLPPVEGDASLNKARHDWEKPDTMILIVRLRVRADFVMGKDSRRQADVGFVPGTSTLTPEGEAAAAAGIGWLASHLASGRMPDAVPRPPPVKRSRARRGTFPPDCVRAV